MKVVDAVAQILKLEGVDNLFAYPLNPLIEAAAQAGIRPIIVRQERTGLHMADAFSRMNAGERIGVFCMQNGPGSENAFGGVAQAYSESVPLVVLPMGYPRALSQVSPNFSSSLNYQHVTKSCEQVLLPNAVPAALRRAFTQAKGYALVPLKMYWKKGKVKVLLGVGQGKNRVDKREDLRKRDTDRQMRNAMMRKVKGR